MCEQVALGSSATRKVFAFLIHFLATGAIKGKRHDHTKTGRRRQVSVSGVGWGNFIRR